MPFIEICLRLLGVRGDRAVEVAETVEQLCAIGPLRQRGRYAAGTVLRIPIGNLARPIGRNQTKARIALVSLGVGIGLDQPTVRGTANNAKNANHARAWPGRQT
jgi:hypothetical protein